MGVLETGVYFAKVNPNGTSQTCPSCFATVSKGFEVREHHCPECGYRTHRDRAAAEMVLDRGLENVGASGTLGNGNRLSSRSVGGL
jgi:putative transposase